MYQQLWGYKVKEKLYLGVREQKRLNTTGLDTSLVYLKMPFRLQIFYEVDWDLKNITKRRLRVYDMCVANFEAQSWPLGHVTKENHNSSQTDRDLTALWPSEWLRSFSFDDWGVRLEMIAFLAATVDLGDKCLPAPRSASPVKHFVHPAWWFHITSRAFRRSTWLRSTYGLAITSGACHFRRAVLFSRPVTGFYCNSRKCFVRASGRGVFWI
jgi:hypothetical protein